MVKLVYENSYGNKVEFTYKFPYFLEQYEGIHEKVSELYGVSSAFSVGELYVGRSVNKRNIMKYQRRIDYLSLLANQNNAINRFLVHLRYIDIFVLKAIAYCI